VLSTTVILAAVLVVLAVAVLAAAVALFSARRALAPLALGHVTRGEVRDERILGPLQGARIAASLAHSAAERGLWAVTSFDARAERLEAGIRGHRQKLDDTTILIAGMGPRIARLRSLAALVFDR
jgi:hypothetical protein